MESFPPYSVPLTTITRTHPAIGEPCHSTVYSFGHAAVVANSFSALRTRLTVIFVVAAATARSISFLRYRCHNHSRYRQRSLTSLIKQEDANRNSSFSHDGGYVHLRRRGIDLCVDIFVDRLISVLQDQVLELVWTVFIVTGTGVGRFLTGSFEARGSSVCRESP